MRRPLTAEQSALVAAVVKDTAACRRAEELRRKAIAKRMDDINAARALGVPLSAIAAAHNPPLTVERVRQMGQGR